MPPSDQPPKPAWNQAAIWTGSELPGLIRIFNRNGWRAHPAFWPGCLIDLGFGLGNSTLGCVENVCFRSTLADVQLHPRPVFIIGHWRTGTTLLHELLGLDPRHTFPTTYQCFLPSHFLLTERWMSGWCNFALTPSRPDAVTLGWQKPQEDEFALCNLGVPSLYASIAFPNHPPQHMDYLTLDSLSAPHRKRWQSTWLSFLKRVHYRRPGRLIVKSPTHTFRIPWLLEMFPEARFVHIVRHPVAVYLSTIRLWKSLYTNHGYQYPRFEQLETFVLQMMQRMNERYRETRNLIPSGQLVEVRFEQLVEQLPDTMRRIYSELGLDSYKRAEPQINDYAAEHAGYPLRRYEPPADVAQRVFEACQIEYDEYGYDSDIAN